MKQIHLLDCTLRDGGYINNWHFGKGIISDICAKLSAARLDIIEVGFLTNKSRTDDDSLYNNCAQIDEIVGGREDPASRVAAMIAIGEMELDPVSLPLAESCALDIVRVTFHNSKLEIEKAFSYARCLMERGYEVCIQPVGTTSYTDKELIDLLDRVNELEPYAFYLVDTLGILQRHELLHFIDLIDHNLGSKIRLGFHSHNNLQMSYANAQGISEYQSSREFILDCSVYGMGRGAGNLCTELISQYENSKVAGRYEMTPIYEILDNYIYPIFLEISWGYNVHYYIAAVHRCHPNYASFLLNKQTLTMNEVDLILKNIPKENRYIYNKKLIETQYYNFQNHNIDDSKTCVALKEDLKGREVLLLAPGKSVNAYRNQISAFIGDKTPVVISINSLLGNFPTDYVFVSNLKRLYMLDTKKLSMPVILTSNLPNIVQGGMYVDYSALCAKEGEERDNSGVMLIRLMQKLGVKQVYLAGYDGFGRGFGDNYFDKKMVNSVNPEDAERKNAFIARQIKEIMQGVEIVTLTPSKYFEA